MNDKIKIPSNKEWYWRFIRLETIKERVSWVAQGFTLAIAALRRLREITLSLRPAGLQSMAQPQKSKINTKTHNTFKRIKAKDLKLEIAHKLSFNLNRQTVCGMYTSIHTSMDKH